MTPFSLYIEISLKLRVTGSISEKIMLECKTDEEDKRWKDGEHELADGNSTER